MKNRKQQLEGILRRLEQKGLKAQVVELAYDPKADWEGVEALLRKSLGKNVEWEFGDAVLTHNPSEIREYVDLPSFLDSATLKFKGYNNLLKITFGDKMEYYWIDQEPPSDLGLKVSKILSRRGEEDWRIFHEIRIKGEEIVINETYFEDKDRGVSRKNATYLNTPRGMVLVSEATNRADESYSECLGLECTEGHPIVEHTEVLGKVRRVYTERIWTYQVPSKWHQEISDVILQKGYSPPVRFFGNYSHNEPPKPLLKSLVKIQ